jgi:hypothetical protein
MLPRADEQRVLSVCGGLSAQRVPALELQKCMIDWRVGRDKRPVHSDRLPEPGWLCVVTAEESS